MTTRRISPDVARERQAAAAREANARRRGAAKATAVAAEINESLGAGALALLEAARFTAIEVQLAGALWRIGAVDFNGVTRGGSRGEPVGLALDLIALANAAEPLPALLSLPAMAPEPVQAAAEPVEPPAGRSPDPFTDVAEPETFDDALADEEEGDDYTSSEFDEEATLEGDEIDVIAALEGEDAPIDADPDDAAERAADLGAPTFPGMMIERDAIARRRLELSMAVDEAAQALIGGRDTNKAGDTDRQRDLNNKLMHGSISDGERAELDRLQRLATWVLNVEDYARAAKRAINEAPPERLDFLSVNALTWPELESP